jgi:hypothetical protein
VKRRPAMFNAFYVDHNGAKQRLTRQELAECWRLWCRHADVRLGRVKAQ